MIEVDPTVLENPRDDDYDSSGYDTSTASLTSSVNQYVFENGRRYHSYYGTDKYLMPTDEKEQDRLDLHHEIMRLAWDDKLHEAPLSEPHRILDIGTGTGIWAIEMADNYPMAEVTGTDLSPIQPNWVPANCRFEVDDAMLNWTFKEVKPRSCTVPGGHVELCENAITASCDDGSVKPDNPAKVYIDHLRAALTKMGRPPPDLEFMKSLLEKAGFEDIKVFQVKEPMGPWPKDPRLKRLGAMVLLHSDTSFESYGMAAFTRILGMEPDKAREMCEAARLAARNKNYHMYGQYYRVYGRKPAVKQ
ncbi:Similar to mRNA 3' acc. no. Q4IPA4 [Pyronema omphalodes CBS 100304]|uniref:Similar to mRNA 3&apos acc. no. Q4IPA4 n=1 Tax=Pyronema omphalodes (strain CBS 100304) TaxID=1076935 RepID=U4LF28_PYROM|nr:Similar to mRNA 3' acc. no. Q4IPA4 [Pyronema omphalodes CBS 100304]